MHVPAANFFVCFFVFPVGGLTFGTILSFLFFKSEYGTFLYFIIIALLGYICAFQLIFMIRCIDIRGCWMGCSINSQQNIISLSLLKYNMLAEAVSCLVLG